MLKVGDEQGVARVTAHNENKKLVINPIDFSESIGDDGLTTSSIDASVRLQNKLKDTLSLTAKVHMGLNEKNF